MGPFAFDAGVWQLAVPPTNESLSYISSMMYFVPLHQHAALLLAHVLEVEGTPHDLARPVELVHAGALAVNLAVLCCLSEPGHYCVAVLDEGASWRVGVLIQATGLRDESLEIC